MSALAPEATLQPERGGGWNRVCPSCRRTLESFPDPPPSGALPKCPRHGLALVDPHELTASEHDPLLGVTIAGRFTITARLGRGSMGSVYRAHQEAMGRDVALKIVRRERAYDPETKARFEREARAISQLTSPHTITAFDFGEAEDGSWFLAMEMLEGETVGERLRREGRIDWRDAVRFTREALRSLAEAHAKGIIHRDLKPDNLFLTRVPNTTSEPRELCKVLDFGIAKWQGGEDTKIDALETQAGTVFGTPRYMSPEQAQGVPLDARSDLYSLGVLLYQMLAGRAPFVDDDAVVVMARHIKDDPPALAEVAADARIPASLDAVVLRSLAKLPADRQQTAEQMSAELERAAELANATASGIQPAANAAAAPEREARRFPGIAAVALVGVIAMIAGLGLALRWTPREVVEPVLGDAPLALPATLRADSASVETPVASEAPAAQTPENSAVAGNPQHASSALPSASNRKPPVRPRSVTPSGLPRKGNERYGRFE